MTTRDVPKQQGDAACSAEVPMSALARSLGGLPRRRDVLAATAAASVAAAAGATSRATASSSSIVVGQSLPLTSPLAAIVMPIVEGQKALIDEVNAQGGVHGMPVRIVTLDDGAQPDRTVANTQRLIDEDRVAALFGYAFVPGLVRAMPLINERRVPLLAVYNGADILRTDANRFLFTTTASLGDEVAAMVRNLVSVHTTRIALAVQDNELGRYMRPLVEAAVKREQATLVVSVALAPDGSNAAVAAQQVAAKSPEGILLLAAGAPVVGFMQALPPASRVAVYALSLAGTTGLTERLGAAARGMAFTQVVPYPLRQTTPLTRRFGAAMLRAKLAPTYDRMWGYLNASILVEALRRAGANPGPGTVYAALERMGELDVGGYRLRYGPEHHNGSSFVEITILDSHGKFLR